MKTITKGVFRNTIPIVAAIAALASVANAQNAIQFTGTKATVENAILLYWASNTNEVYEVDYADQLNGNYDGTTVWMPLYTGYPSHGTNSFIADAGNYDSDPQVAHPKYSPMRFYRIVNTGQNDGNNPTVSISSPANGAALSGETTVSVSSYSDGVLSSVKLYVDGEEQYDSDDGTNFVINTCEWANGPHVLFAVAKSQSDFTGLPGNYSVTYGSAVSSYVTVNFSNLITRYDFSQLFFQPGNGQTQTVTAAFAANCNWTIQVQDENSNVVRSASGSGISMSWDFDGYDSNGALLQPALYWYVLAAQTNGLLSQISSGGGSGGPGGPPMPSLASTMADSMELFAMPNDGSGAAVPLAIYPPGYDTNSLTIFEASWSEMTASRTAPLLSAASMGSTVTPNDASPAGYGGPSSASTKGPSRKPKERHIGVLGNYGILYQEGSLYCKPPKLTMPLPPYYVKIDGDPVGASLANPAEPRIADVAKSFVTGMKNSGYTNSWSKGSGKWTVNELKGDGALINTVNLGLVIAHASYGETAENGADAIKHTYTWLTDGSYVHLNDMRLGAGGTLRWMTMLTCNTLRDQNIQSYSSAGGLGTIINDNLHLLLSANTVMSGTENTTAFYAANLKKKMTFPTAWYKALRDSIAKASTQPSGTRVAKVMGHQPCFNDQLMSWQDPDPGIYSQTNQVYP
jgi:hypothetical protein